MRYLLTVGKGDKYLVGLVIASPLSVPANLLLANHILFAMDVPDMQARRRGNLLRPFSNP